MDCVWAREALSGHLDGETAEEDPADVDAHVAGCAPCRQWLAAARDVTRRARLRVAPAVPDLTGRVLAALEREHPHRWDVRRWQRWLRLGLLTVALAQLALSVPMLLLGHDHGAPEHIARELGSFDLALAVGFLAVARRPDRAGGLRPLIGVTAAALLLTATVDVTHGQVALFEEAPHLLTAAGWLLLRLLAGPPARRPRSVPTATGPVGRRWPVSLRGHALRFALRRELPGGVAAARNDTGCTMEGDAFDVRSSLEVPPPLRDSA